MILCGLTVQTTVHRPVISSPLLLELAELPSLLTQLLGPVWRLCSWALEELAVAFLERAGMLWSSSAEVSVPSSATKD